LRCGLGDGKTAASVMRKLHRLGWLAVALAAAGEWPGQASDTIQWRPGVAVRLLHEGRWEGWLAEENWFNDQGPNPAYVQISPRLRFTVNPYLALGLNYSFIESHSAAPDGDDYWTAQNRLEFEVNPRLKLESGWQFNTRNRIEFRWIEHASDVNYRTRNLLEVVYPVKLPKPFKDLCSNGEFFYDWSRMRSSEHRLSPLGVDLALSQRVELRVYYTWRQVESNNDWVTTHVFGTSLRLKLK
jgi:hypothetical protein